MGVRITSQEDIVAIFDSVSGYAFGPTFATENDAEDFLCFLDADGTGPDARTLSPLALEQVHSDWLNARSREA